MLRAMQNAVRFDAEIDEDRVVHLPREVPLGRAEIIVLLPTPRPRAPSNLAALVGMLRAEHPAPSDDEIRQILDEAKMDRGGR